MPKVARQASVVTKSDLREMELRLIAQLRSEMNRMMLAVIGALTVIIALIEFLTR